MGRSGRSASVTPSRRLRSNTSTPVHLSLVNSPTKRKTPKVTLKKQKETIKDFSHKDDIVLEFVSTKEQKKLVLKLEQARSTLLLNSKPTSLPGRELEHETIMGLVLENINENKGSCIYVSGVPGTGKTATVKSVIQDLRETEEFDFFELNGMKLSDPNTAFTLLAKHIFKKQFSTPNLAVEALEARFAATSNKKNTRTPLVVLVDELDLLVTRNQKVIYNFFDWPNRPNSNLIVVAISNTMDLPERVLLNRVSSRLGLTRIDFKPYTFTQLEEIVTSRLSGLNVFEDDAISYVSRKVSSVSGDARKALDICRRAVEILQSDNSAPRKPGVLIDQVVTVDIIGRAIKDIFSSPALVSLKTATLNQKIFLGAVVKCVRIAGRVEVDFYNVVNEHQYFCSTFKVACPTFGELTTLCSNLGFLSRAQTETLIKG